MRTDPAVTIDLIWYLVFLPCKSCKALCRKKVINADTWSYYKGTP